MEGHLGRVVINRGSRFDWLWEAEAANVLARLTVSEREYCRAVTQVGIMLLVVVVPEVN